METVERTVERRSQIAGRIVKKIVLGLKEVSGGKEERLAQDKIT